MPQPRRRRLLVAGIVVLAVALAGGTTWWVVHQRDLARQAELLGSWESDLGAWEADTLTLLTDPPIRISSQVDGQATEPTDQIDAINATCTQANAHAEAVAAAPGPPGPPDELSEHAVRRAEVEQRSSRDAEALAAYQSAVAEPSRALARFCGVYPAIAQIRLDQRAALDSFGSLLTSCPIAATGCLPADAAEWAQVADAVEVAYLDPTERLADVYAAGCPVAELAPVCAAEADDAAAIVPLYADYVAALRAGDEVAVTQAREAIAVQRDDGRTAYADAVASAVAESGGQPGDDAAADAADLLRTSLTDTENALLDADEDLIAALG